MLSCTITADSVLRTEKSGEIKIISRCKNIRDVSKSGVMELDCTQPDTLAADQIDLFV